MKYLGFSYLFLLFYFITLFFKKTFKQHEGCCLRGMYWSRELLQLQFIHVCHKSISNRFITVCSSVYSQSIMEQFTNKIEILCIICFHIKRASNEQNLHILYEWKNCLKRGGILILYAVVLFLFFFQLYQLIK